MIPPSRQKIVLALLVGAAILATGPGLVQLVWQFRLFLGRATFPIDLEWMEGGTLIHAQRIAAGQGIYVAPSLDFIPYLYTPLYPALLALLSFVLPLGYLLGRVVSILAFAAALAFVILSAVDQASGRSRRLLAMCVGMGGAGAVAASFAFTGYFFDLVRADSLLLMLEGFALWLALRGRGWKSAALCGLTIALAFFTKQTATIIGIGLGLGLLIAAPRRGIVYGLVAALTLAAGTGLLVKLSGGWFWTYIFKLHQSHAFRGEAVRVVAWPLTQQFAWPLFAALVIAVATLAFARRLRRSDAVLLAVALAGVVAALVGFGTQWADSNAFVPAIYFPAFAAAVYGARLLNVAREGTWLAACAVAAALLLGSQSLHTAKPEARRTLVPAFIGWPRPGAALTPLASAVPSAVDRAAAKRLLDELRALPEPLFIPFHPYYAVLVGKRPFVHRMGVQDVAAALGRPRGLDQAIAEQYFAAIVLDWKSYPGEWPHLGHRYRPVRELVEGANSVRTFAGAQTSPRFLLVPAREP